MSRRRAVVTIGNFDGVHAGHTALIARAKDIAAANPSGTRVVALAFDPHPATMLAPERAPPRLTTFEERARLLGLAGADEVVRLEPTGNLLSLEPEAFVRRLVEDFDLLALVEGEDFRFGRERMGGIDTLRSLGAGFGFGVAVVAPVEVALTDGTIARASSTLARWLLGHGRVGDARAVLGRSYAMTGVVERGDQRGRQIGLPTANLTSGCMAPGDGVYAGHAELDDGREFVAAISVGTKPTFEGAAPAVEAYLLDAAGTGAGWRPIAGLPEYGWGMRLRFEHWVRDQLRFDGVGPLVEQMHRDCDRVREMTAGKEATCR